MPITPHLVTKWRVLLKTNCLSKVEYLSDCYGNIPEYLRTGQYLNNDNCRKNFGPKGYGFGGGAGTLSMDDGKGYKTNPNEVGALLQSFWIIEDQWGSVRIGEDRWESVRIGEDHYGSLRQPQMTIAGGPQSKGLHCSQKATCAKQLIFQRDWYVGRYFMYIWYWATFLGSKAPGSGGPKPKPKWGGADICPRWAWRPFCCRFATEVYVNAGVRRLCTLRRWWGRPVRPSTSPALPAR